MRASGIRTVVYGENRRVKSKIAYADKLGAPFAVFLGEDELTSGRMTVKDLRSGEQTSASPEILMRGMREKLEAMRGLPPVRERGGADAKAAAEGADARAAGFADILTENR
jgi:histidyl-tRNA synthetase